MSGRRQRREGGGGKRSGGNAWTRSGGGGGTAVRNPLAAAEGGAGARGARGGDGSPAGGELADIGTLSTELLRLTKTKIEQMAGRLGSAGDTRNARKGVHAAITRGEELCERIDRGLHGMRTSRTARTDPAALAAATQSCEDCVRRFRSAVEKYTRAERSAGAPRADPRAMTDDPAAPSAARERTARGGAAAGDLEMQAMETRMEGKLRAGQVDLEYQLARERGEDVERIANEAVSIHQMTGEMAELVDEQDERIDKMVSHIDSAADAVHAGTESLDRAIDHQKSYRKKICFMIIIAVLLLALICIPVLISIGRGGKK